MEIFRRHGVADRVYARSIPRENLGKIFWPITPGAPPEQNEAAFA